jgi:hypothetical protein
MSSIDCSGVQRVLAGLQQRASFDLRDPRGRREVMVHIDPPATRARTRRLLVSRFVPGRGSRAE